MPLKLILLAAAALVLSSCSSNSGSGNTVKMETSKGDIVIQINPEWAPRGADRFIDLVKSGYYDGARFFRVVPDFVVQFGLAGDPALSAKWSDNNIPDDPPGQTNAAGTVVFATRGPNTRTSQVFINLVDNARLDQMGFTPFGRVVEGMSVVQQLYSGYGDAPPNGNGPDQGRIRAEGNAYLQREFPQLDFIKNATVQ